MRLGILGALLVVAVFSYTARETGPVEQLQPVTTAQAQLHTALNSRVKVLVRMESHDYGAAIAVIEAADGKITHTFRYARGLAATVPAKTVLELRRVKGVLGVGIDETRRLAAGSLPMEYDRSLKNQVVANRFPGILPLGGEISAVNQLDDKIRQGVVFDLESKFDAGEKIALDTAQIETLAQEVVPATYANAAVQNAIAVWSQGNLGQGTTTAVIDSGVYGDHFMLAGSLVGCVDLSSDVGTAQEGCSRPGNHFHGTHVASTIAGNGALVIAADSPIATAISRHAGPLVNASNLGFPGGKVLPLLGVAPSSQIYGVKVFPHTGLGAPTSTIIAGIEHVITQKLAGVDIDVINMSLGGPTTFDGRTLEDQAVDAATAAGMAVVVSAGNEGPSSQTVSGPATAQSAISVGAIAHPVQMRTFWDFNFFPSNSGQQLFVSDVPQMAYFSSRGDSADGRAKPALSAPGTFVLAAFISAQDPDGIGFSSGTSMAAPGVAGTVALMNTAADLAGIVASPFDHAQALSAGADPLPGYGSVEQGAGANNAAAAVAALLADNNLGEAFPALPPADPASPVPPAGIDLGLIGGGSTTIQVQNLQPGMNQHYYFKTSRDTSRIAVNVSDVKTRRNPFKINSFEFYLKTGTRSFEHYYVGSANVFGDAQFEVTDRSTTASGAVSGAFNEEMLIQPGYTRITIENDWTSSGPISGHFEVIVEENGNPTGDARIPGIIAGSASGGMPASQFLGFAPCPALTCRVDLTWENDWSAYPTTDLDLVLFGLNAGGGLVLLDLSGASLNAPESNNNSFIIPDGAPVEDVESVGILVDAFETHGAAEPYIVDYFAP